MVARADKFENGQLGVQWRTEEGSRGVRTPPILTKMLCVIEKK